MQTTYDNYLKEEEEKKRKADAASKYYPLETAKDSVSSKVSLKVTPKELGYSSFNGYPKILYDNREADINSDQIIGKAEFEDGYISMKKTSKGYIIVKAESVLNAIEQALKEFPQNEMNLSRLKKHVTRAIEAGATRRKNFLNKKETEDKKTFIRDLGDVKKVEKALNDAFLSKRNEYIMKYEDSILRRFDYVKKYIDESEHKTLSRIFQTSMYAPKYERESKQSMYDFAKKYFIDKSKGFLYGKDGEKLIEPKPDYEKLMHEEAEKMVDEMQKEYIFKNIYKVGTIINHKDNFKEIQTIYTTIGAVGFEGQFKIIFEDGSEFTAYTQAVFAEGSIQKAHYRFPLTFHNVKFPDGKTYKKLSEEEMNNYFAYNKSMN